MNLIQTLLMLMLMIGAVIAMMIAVISWQKQSESWGRSFSLLCVAAVNWSLGAAFEFAIPTLEAKIFWINVQYFSIALIPVIILAFALTYTQRSHWLSPRAVSLLLLVPAITILLAWTNINQLFIQDIVIVEEGPLPLVSITYGPWFWVHTVVGYGETFFALGLMAAEVVTADKLRRRQAAVILAAFLIPITGSVLSVLKIVPLDVAALAFVISGIIIGWALLGFQLFDVGPIARRLLIDNMRDGMISIDQHNRIVDVNPTMMQILGQSRHQIIGQQIANLFPLMPNLRKIWEQKDDTAVEIVEIDTAEAQAFFSLNLSLVNDEHGRLKGYLIVLRDISHLKQVEQELRKQTEQFESLVSVAYETSRGLDIEKTLRAVLGQAVELTGAERGSLLLLDASLKITNSLIYNEDVDQEEYSPVLRRVMEDGLAHWVATHGQSALIRDTEQDARWLDLAEYEGAHSHSVLCTPLIYQQSVLGVLTLSHGVRDKFTRKDLQLIEASSGQMALALHNSYSYEQQRQQAIRRRTIYEFLQTIGRERDPLLVAQTAVDLIADLTPWPTAVVSLYNAPSERLDVYAARNLPGRDGLTQIPLVDTLHGAAVDSGQTQLNGDGTGVTHQEISALEALIVVPIRKKERILGTLSIGDVQRQEFKAEDIKLAESLGGALSLALDNSLAHEEINAYLADLDLLYEASRKISQTMNLEVALGEALQAALKLTQFDMGVVTAADLQTGQLTLVAAQHIPSQIVDVMQQNGLDQTICEHTYQSDQALQVVEAETFVTPSKELAHAVRGLKGLDAQAYVGVPLIFRGTSYGTICLFNQTPLQLPQRQITLLNSLAQQIGATITNTRAFTEIKRQHGQLQAVIESNLSGILALDLELQIQVINQQALTLLGVEEATPADWVYRSAVDLLHRLRRSDPQLVRMILDRRDDLENVAQYEGHRGEINVNGRFMGWVVVPVTINQEIVGQIFTITDMTSEKEAAQFRETMIRTMVHDIRSPLSSVYTTITYLQDWIQTVARKPPAAEQMIAYAFSGVQETLALVNSILDISRLESGATQLSCQKCELIDLVDEVFLLQEMLAHNKQIKLKNEVGEDLPPIFVDTSLIKRVLQNLIDNAIKFTPAGGRVLITAHTEQTKKGLKLCASVQDNGSGILPEIQGQLFRMFFTGEDENSGSGLGLAFCKLALQFHGEDIWIDNSSESGTTFQFSLPVYTNRSGSAAGKAA